MGHASIHQRAQLQREAPGRGEGEPPRYKAPQRVGACLLPTGLSAAHQSLHCQGGLGGRKRRVNGGMGKEQESDTSGYVQKQPRQLCPALTTSDNAHLGESAPPTLRK